MVPDANSLSMEELPEVATSQNNVEYRFNYNRFYQGRIDRFYYTLCYTVLQSPIVLRISSWTQILKEHT